MLWNVIYEFFVKYIFGGMLWHYDYSGDSPVIVYDYYGSNAFVSQTHAPSDLLNINVSLFGLNTSLANYFCLIATIITMVVILVLCCALIKKIYNMCAHIIG